MPSPRYNESSLFHHNNPPALATEPSSKMSTRICEIDHASKPESGQEASKCENSAAKLAKARTKLIHAMKTLNDFSKNLPTFRIEDPFLRCSDDREGKRVGKGIFLNKTLYRGILCNVYHANNAFTRTTCAVEIPHEGNLDTDASSPKEIIDFIVYPYEEGHQDWLNSFEKRYVLILGALKAIASHSHFPEYQPDTKAQSSRGDFADFLDDEYFPKKAALYIDFRLPLPSNPSTTLKDNSTEDTPKREPVSWDRWVARTRSADLARTVPNPSLGTRPIIYWPI